MNYKSLFHRVVSVISSPSKTWAEIALSTAEQKNVLQDYVYPLIGLCGLCEFIGVFFGKEFAPEVFQVALTRCCALAVALFGGFFLSVYLLDKLFDKFFGIFRSKTSIQVFVAYSMTVPFVLDIFSSLFAIQLILIILQIYTLFVVFEGARRYLNIDENKITLFTIMATIIILCCPFIIELVFNKLSVTLN